MSIQSISGNTITTRYASEAERVQVAPNTALRLRAQDSVELGDRRPQIDKQRELSDEIERKKKQIEEMREEMKEAQDRQSFWNLLGSFLGGPVIGSKIGEPIESESNHGEEKLSYRSGRHTRYKPD